MDPLLKVIEDCSVVLIKGRVEARHVDKDNRLDIMKELAVDMTPDADIFLCRI